MTDVQTASPEPVAATAPVRASGLSRSLNRYFHHLDRGGSLRGEIAAGVAAFFVAICVLFVNVQVVAAAINGDVTLTNAPANPANIAAAQTYAELYVGSILVAFLGTLLIGLVARLPFVQLATLGLTGSLFTLVGSGSGLTYQNVLFVNLVAAVAYVVVVAVPAVRRFLVRAIPVPVRQALPAALGILLTLLALRSSGLVTTETVEHGGSGLVSSTLVTGLADFSAAGAPSGYVLLGVGVAVVLYLVSRVLRWKHPVLWSFLGGTVAYAGSLVAMAGTDVSNTGSFLNFGRIWFVASSQANPATPYGDSYLSYFSDAIGAVLGNLGEVLDVGTDFSGYTGSTLALVLAGVLGYVLVGVLDTTGTVDAAHARFDGSDPAEPGAGDGVVRGALVVNAVTNLAAPFLGTGGVRTSTGSLAAVEDDGRSGIASVVASLGLLVSLFITVFPALFATAFQPVESMNKWNYNAYGNGGMVYLAQGLAFDVAHVVVICVGLSVVVRALRPVRWSRVTEWVPVLVTVLAAAALTNIAFGAAFGLVASVLLGLLARGRADGGREPVRLPTIVLLVLLVGTLVLSVV